MRSLWRGSISFGLINIPVGLISATKPDMKFVLLHKKDLSEVKYARICKEEGKEIPYDEIVRGIERNGQLKVFSSDEIKKAQSERSDYIEIVTFCDEKEVDAIYFEKPYYLQPEKGGEKAYSLLLNALNKSKKVAVTNFVFKNHPHIGIIKPHNKVLTLITMRYHDQIIDTKNLDVSAKTSTTEIDLAMKLITELSGHFKPEDFKNPYVTSIESAIKKKRKSVKVVTKVKEKGQEAKVYDIMSLLKESLDKKPKKRASKA